VNTDLLLWLWRDFIEPSWLSLALAPVVLTGYCLLGRRQRAGWWFVIASNAGLLAIGLTNRQYGLVVVSPDRLTATSCALVSVKPSVCAVVLLAGLPEEPEVEHHSEAAVS